MTSKKNSNEFFEVVLETPHRIWVVELAYYFLAITVNRKVQNNL